MKPGRVIPANVDRMIDAAIDDMRKNAVYGRSSILAGPIFTAPPTPKSCDTCGKGERHMRHVYSQHTDYECSHVDCPHRGRVTAQPTTGA